MALPDGEFLEHKTVRVTKNNHTTVTIIEKDETNGLLLQQTNVNGKKNCLEVLTKADLVRYANAPGWNRIRKTLLLLLLVVILGLIGGAIYVVAIQRTCPPEPWSTSWWKHSLMYQISVKSFQDSNGDGVGDLAGVLSRLDYIQSIGVQSILLNPIFLGVNGNSFAVRDFQNIDPSVGTMQDFDDLVEEVHRRNMTIVMDFILTHTAKEHHWFGASEMNLIDRLATNSDDEPAKDDDFYVWHSGYWDTSSRDDRGESIPGPPNSWKNLDDGGTSAWTWGANRRQYYLHQYANGLPSLNYASETLAKVMDEVVNFWLRRHIDGFRFLDIKDIFTGPNKYSANSSDPILPVEVVILLKRWKAIMNAPSRSERQGIHRVLIVDGDGLSINQLNGMHGVDLVFNRNLMKWDSSSKNPGQEIASLVDSSLKSASSSPLSWAIGNYDQHRSSSRIGSVELMDGVNMIYLLLPGTGIAFYGDELGLKDGKGAQGNSKNSKFLSMGPQITPMLWTSDRLAGFTNASTGPWLDISLPYLRTEGDTQSQQRAHHSRLKVFQQIARLRTTDAIRSGTYRPGVIGESVFSFIRQTKCGNGYLVLVDLRKNGLLDTHPRAYSLSSARLTGTGVVVLASGSIYKTKNGAASILAAANATVDLTTSVVLRESEAVVIKFPNF